MTIQLEEDDFTKDIQPGHDFQKEREPRQFYGGKSKTVGTWGAHLCTDVAWRKKIYKHFVFYKYFCLVLGLPKSRILEKTIEPLLNKPDFKLFHYKARVQPVSKITTVATRNRCWL